MKKTKQNKNKNNKNKKMFMPIIFYMRKQDLVYQSDLIRFNTKASYFLPQNVQNT